MIKPMSRHVVVEFQEQKNETESGIILAKADTSISHLEGEVLKVAPDVSEVEIGSIILFKKWAGQELKVGNKKYIVLHIDDVYAVKE